MHGRALVPLAITLFFISTGSVGAGQAASAGGTRHGHHGGGGATGADCPCQRATVPAAPGGAHHGHHGAGRGTGCQSGKGDASHASDMAAFHFLLDNGSAIRRTITERPDGVETLTESDDPEIAATIKAHVQSMSARIQEGRPIHQRDPLFRELFAHRTAIEMAVEPTAKGVRVVETSQDSYVVKLIKAHAAVVSRFVANGRREAMTDHPLPAM